MSNEWLTGGRIYEDVVAYTLLGEHRSATPADARTTEWLARELEEAGYRVTTEPFTLRQFFLRECNLVVGGDEVPCFPLWWPRPTGTELVSGPLAELEAGRRFPEGGIAFATLPFDARSTIYKGSGHREKLRAAVRAGAVAVVLATEGPTGEIIAANCLPRQREWPIPMLVVPGRCTADLCAAAQEGHEAQISIEGEYSPHARAENLVGHLDRGPRRIVISTPQSGWFRCGGERGPGIALFLGLARWAVARPDGPSHTFVSTSGHELGGLGMRRFLRRSAPKSSDVLCWLHLGAGIATWDWEEVDGTLRKTGSVDHRRFLMCSPELAPLLEHAFAGLPGLTPIPDRAVGELAAIMAAGYRCFGIAAGHTYHHTPADGPQMTAPQLLGPVAEALLETFEELAELGTVKRR